MEVEECKGLANTWPIAVGRTLRRRQRLLLPAPVLTARPCVSCGKPHLCLLLLRRIPQHSSPTSQRERLPPRLPPQSPSISQARHLLLRPLRQRCKPPRSGFAASQNATASPAPLSRGCLSSSTASSITTKPPTTKCRHTSFITPLPAWSVAAKLLCNH